MVREPRRTGVGALARGVLGGSACGLVVVVCTALGSRSGHDEMARQTAQGVMLLALAGTAVVVILAHPARMLRARIPLGRPVPHAWWPQPDSVPLLAVCVGTPVVAGAGAAILLVH